MRSDHGIRSALTTLKPTIRFVRPAKSDQPVHPCGLIGDLAERMCLHNTKTCSTIFDIQSSVFQLYIFSLLYVIQTGMT